MIADEHDQESVWPHGILQCPGFAIHAGKVEINCFPAKIANGSGKRNHIQEALLNSEGSR
jgi:hypothetical protein